MRKVSAQLVSTKPVSLSRAAKLISRFAAVENGSSAAVSLYLQRSADAFNHLVQFHKQSKTSEKPDGKKVKKSKTDSLGTNPDEANADTEDFRSIRENDGNTVAAEANPNVDLMGNGEKEPRKEKKKKKKRKSDSVDAEGNPNGNEVKDLGSGEKEQRKKKKKKEKRKSEGTSLDS